MLPFWVPPSAHFVPWAPLSSSSSSFFPGASRERDGGGSACLAKKRQEGGGGVTSQGVVKMMMALPLSLSLSFSSCMNVQWVRKRGKERGRYLTTVARAELGSLANPLTQPVWKKWLCQPGRCECVWFLVEEAPAAKRSYTRHLPRRRHVLEAGKKEFSYSH